MSFQPTDKKEIESERLFEEELVLVVPLNHRFSGRGQMKMADLDGEPLALLSRGFCTRRIIEDCFRQADVEPNVVVEMNSVEGVLAVAVPVARPRSCPAWELRTNGRRPFGSPGQRPKERSAC